MVRVVRNLEKGGEGKSLEINSSHLSLTWDREARRVDSHVLTQAALSPFAAYYPERTTRLGSENQDPIHPPTSSDPKKEVFVKASQSKVVEREVGLGGELGSFVGAGLESEGKDRDHFVGDETKIKSMRRTDRFVFPGELKLDLNQVLPNHRHKPRPDSRKQESPQMRGAGILRSGSGGSQACVLRE